MGKIETIFKDNTERTEGDFNYKKRKRWIMKIITENLNFKSMSYKRK